MRSNDDMVKKCVAKTNDGRQPFNGSNTPAGDDKPDDAAMRSKNAVGVDRATMQAPGRRRMRSIASTEPASGTGEKQYARIQRAGGHKGRADVCKHCIHAHAMTTSGGAREHKTV